MMIKTAARKGKSIDEIISQMPTSQLDLLQVKVEPSRIKELLSIFESEYLPVTEREKKEKLRRGLIRTPLGIILKPEEMPLLVQCLTEYEPHPHFKRTAGDFLSGVLQDSYDVGYNHFFLHLPFEIEYLASRIRGATKRHISLKVFNAGDYFGEYSSHLTAKLENPGSFCGKGSSYCRFLVQGDTKYFGHGTSHMQATLKGQAKQLGYFAQASSFKCTKAVTIPGLLANSCRFNIETIENFYFDAEFINSFAKTWNCSYLVQDQEAALRLAKILLKGNKIICGNTVVRDYDD